MNSDEFWNQVDEVMKRSIENSTRSIFDEYIKQNAANRASVGITAKIVRKMHSETCEWCRSLAGVYIYGQEPHEVYQRHDNCDCTVEYFCEKGIQNVWESNNKFIEENDYKKKERISYIIGVEIDDPKLLIENNTIYHNNIGITLRAYYQNDTFKNKVLQSHEMFAKLGWKSSEHFNRKLIGRIESGRIKSEREVLEVLSKKSNYIDLETHRYVRCYNKIGILIDDINGELVTIVPRNKPKSTWVKIL